MIRKIRKLDSQGFTLVELLAIISILSLIMTISIYTVNKVIKETKDKSYQVTVNNIEKESMNYLSENSKEIFFLSNNNIEYQCVTVKNLVDAGYFKSNIEESKVSSDRNVKMNDYVYVERDVKTKAVTRTKLVLSATEIRLCDMAIKSSYDVSFSIEPDTWSKSKEVKITYKLNNPNSLDEYEYKYSVGDTASGIEGDNVYHDFSNDTVIVKYTAVNNGVITANIKYKDGSEDTYIKEISGIDNEKPEISSIDGDNTWKRERKIKITLSDSESGLDKDNIKVKYGWSEINTKEPSSYIDGKLSYSDNDRKASFDASGSNITGKYYLWVKVDNFCDKVSNCVDNNEIVSSNTYWFDNEKPKVSINVDSYNKFSYTGEDDHSGIDKYYVSNSKNTPTDSSTWISDTSKEVTSKGTYYVFAKDMAGNISDSVSISAYTISKSVGDGTSLSIKYNDESGNIIDGNSIVVLDGTKIWAKVNTKTGYNSPVLKQNGNSIDNPSVINITNDVEISSSAGVVVYTITYDANGGSNAPSVTTYEYASSGTINLSSAKPTRSNYKFLGWSIDSSATSAEYLAGGEWNRNVSSNTTLYAVWKYNPTYSCYLQKQTCTINSGCKYEACVQDVNGNYHNCINGIIKENTPVETSYSGKTCGYNLKVKATVEYTWKHCRHTFSFVCKLPSDETFTYESENRYYKPMNVNSGSCYSNRYVASVYCRSHSYKGEKLTYESHEGTTSVIEYCNGGNYSSNNPMGANYYCVQTNESRTVYTWVD